MSKVSIVIPSNKEIFLQKTIDDIVKKAKGDYEIIAVLDGYWPDPILKDYPNLHLIHKTNVEGMRPAINDAVRISKGDYIMKADGHCMFEEGFDEIMKADCEDDWISVPRRRSLEPEAWTILDNGKAPIDYHYLAWPFRNPEEVGMHGNPWVERAKERKDILIDDEMSSQGSCWFMSRKHFDRLGGLQCKGYGTFIQEFQEIGNKTWLLGGRVVINKKTWYAHLHKGKTYRRGYYISQKKMVDGALYSTWFWLTDQLKDRKYNFKWLVEKFWPIPTWSLDWEKQMVEWMPKVNEWSTKDGSA